MANKHEQQRQAPVDTASLSQPDVDAIQVSAPFKHHHSFLHVPVKVYAIVGTALLALALGGTAFFFHTHNRKQVTVDETVTNAHTDVLNGNFSEAEKSLQRSLKNAKDDKQRANIELGIAEAKANSGDYAGAIAHAKAANGYSESVEAYGLIGFAAKQSEQWKVAVAAYTKAADLSSSAGRQQEVQYYKNLAAEAGSNL